MDTLRIKVFGVFSTVCCSSPGPTQAEAVLESNTDSLKLFFSQFEPFGESLIRKSFIEFALLTVCKALIIFVPFFVHIESQNMTFCF